LPLSAFLLLASLAAGVVAQGGYYGPGQWVLGVLLALAVMAAVRERRITPADLRSGPVVAAATLALWVVLAAALGGAPSAATGWLLMVAGFVAALSLARTSSATVRNLLVGGLLGLGVLTAMVGWVGVVWRLEPWALASEGLWRSATTLTYSNAAAGLLVPLALVALARAAEATTAGPGLVAWSLLSGIAATASRGGVIALIVGGVVLMIVAGPRRVARTAVGPVLGAVVTFAGLAPSMAEGSATRPLLAIAGLGLGATVAWWGWRRPGATAVVGVCLAAGLAVAAAGLGVSADLAPRFTLRSADRVAEFRAALDVAAERPIAGVGPGQAVLVWATDTPPSKDRFAVETNLVSAKYAHNAYLQTLAEIGLVGLALVLALAVLLGRAVWANRTGSCAAVRAGVVAGLAALALHGGVDFLWHVPVIPLTAAVLAGAAMPRTTKEDTC
jgi:hypothetical protein